jgi:E3 SUMO-protein ligase PIAS1
VSPLSRYGATLMAVRKKQDDDDDIVFGQSRMSLKDPLSYMRLVRPVRSSKCSHLQCFEAKWWIVGNEKHPQWLCPLCNRALRFDELIVDGFSLDILDVVPEKYDEVVIEADNTWHTEDGAYGSSSWLALNAKSAQSTRAPTPKKEDEDTKPDQFRLSTSPDPKGKRKAIEILSSDDEDEPPLSKSNPGLQPPIQPRQLSASAAPGSRPPSTQPAPKPNNAIIDLTLDSDDEEVEDAVTNFDRPAAAGSSNMVSASAQTLAPPTTNTRAGPSTARSPSYTFPNHNGEASNGAGNGYSNGNGNGSISRPESYTNGNGRPYPQASTSTSTEAARQVTTDRYVPPYMPTRPEAPFTYNPKNKHNNPNPIPYRPHNPPAPNQPVDSWRAEVHDERNRKRDRDRERGREMETDSEDEDYRYSRRH